MPLRTHLPQWSFPQPQRKLVAAGFLGLPILILGTILVQVVRGSALFTVFLVADQGTTYSLWLLPLFGFLVWSCNCLAGVRISSHVEGRTSHLARILWWSGIGMEVLCLAIIVSTLNSV